MQIIQKEESGFKKKFKRDGKKKHNCYGFMNNKLSALRNVLLKALNDSFSIFCVFLFVEEGKSVQK